MSGVGAGTCLRVVGSLPAGQPEDTSLLSWGLSRQLLGAPTDPPRKLMCRADVWQARPDPCKEFRGKMAVGHRPTATANNSRDRPWRHLSPVGVSQTHQGFLGSV